MGFSRSLFAVSAVVLLVALSACTKKQEADPIVLPPGQVVDYSNSQFLPISQSYYSVDLQRLDDLSGQFFSIQDLTPEQNKEIEQSVHFVIPKNQNEPGVFILRVTMPRSSLNLSAFVLPERSIQPSMVTTLAVELLTQYPSLDLHKIGVTEVLAIEDEARQMISRVQAELGVTMQSMTPRQWLRFLENYAARDPNFLSVAKQLGLSFETDSQGQANGVPYPFTPVASGIGNKVPTLDVGNSTPRSRPIAAIEAMDVKVRARMQDNENDFLVYHWFLDGVPYIADGDSLTWTPGYFDSRTDPYSLTVKVSDGGLPVEIPWLVSVADHNRPPEIVGTCDLAAKETELWSCTIEAIDFDLDPITFTMSDKSTSARATIDGQMTDDTTRKTTISGKTSVKIEFTPNNNDARKHGAYIEVVVDDGKLGKTFIPLNLIVDDINSPPLILVKNGSVIQPFSGMAPPHEFDFCTQKDPDTGLSAGYRFFIEVEDPDNQLSAGPRANEPDIVSAPVLAGSLSGDILALPNSTPGCPASSPAHSVFCYEWKPKSEPHSGKLSFTVRDDHGGVTTIPNESLPTEIILSSEDRNLNPCITSTSVSVVLDDTNQKRILAATATDADNDAPLYEIYGVPNEVVPLLTDELTGEYLTFRKTRFNPTEWTSRFASSTSSSVNASAWENRPLSGYLTFTRLSPHTADMTISSGTILKTSTPSLKIQYSVAQTTVMQKNDLAVTVPVVAVTTTGGQVTTGRRIEIGKLNRFIAAPPAADLVVSNPGGVGPGGVALSGVLTAGGTVKLARTITGTALTVSHGTEFGTNEVTDGTDTIRYETLDDVFFRTTDTVVAARVRRKVLTAAIDTVNVTAATWPGPALTITNPIPLTDKALYTLVQQQSTGVDKAIYFRALDDAVVPDRTTLSPMTPLAGYTFETSGATEFEGWVNVKRSSTGSADVVPVGTAIGLLNHTNYALVEDAVFNPGDSMVTVPVRRLNAYGSVISASGNKITLRWSDINYAPIFVSPMTVKVTEGSTLLSTPLEVNDNAADYSDPKDPLDLHTFTYTVSVPGPVGPFQFCREPGTDPAGDLSLNCTSCDTAGSTYWTSALCYFRFRPALADNGKAFSFTVTANDHGAPGGARTALGAFNVMVVEKNDPPAFSDSHFNPVIGYSKDHPINEGLPPFNDSQPWDYVEGLDPGYRFYMSDPDWGADTKTISTPTLVRTWQFVSPTGWVTVPNPSGLSMALVPGSLLFNDPPPGSRAVAQVSWKPWDQDAKRLAGPAGFVIEVKVCDVGNGDSPKACSDTVNANAFFKLTVRNQQNAPSIATTTPIATLTATADKYYMKDFTVQDLDYAANSTAATPIPAAANFQSMVSLCSGGVYDCVADSTGWPQILRDPPDSPYLNNSTVAACQNSSGTLFYSRPEFKLPAAAPITTPCPVAGNCVAYTGPYGSVVSQGSNLPPIRNYTYSFRWCPQRKHIGKHTITFNVRDNGDQDFRGVPSLLPAIISTFQVTLNVVAPVFFDSPKADATLGNGTASWWMKQAFTNSEFRYMLIPNNSKGSLLTIDLPGVPAQIDAATTPVGVVSLEVWPILNPVARLRFGDSTTTPKYTVTNVNTATEQVILVWRPYGATTTTKYVSNPSDQATWPLFQLRVKDQTTAEGETVKFRVQVKDVSSPVNSAPVIASQFPSASAVAISEQIPQVFSIAASDTNSDYLHYRWFLDGKLVNDAGAAFTYLPSMDDSIKSATGLALGQHTLSVEVTDGLERTGASKIYRAWNIYVRNTSPFPTIVNYSNVATPWAAGDAKWAGLLGSITNLGWGPTIGVGTKTGSIADNYLLFSGQYTRAGLTRNFVSRVQFKNGLFQHPNTLTTTTMQLREGLPWSASRKTEHVSFIMPNASTISNFLVSSVANPDVNFNVMQDAMKVNFNMASYPSTWTPLSSDACTGSCAQNFFTGVKALPSSAAVTAGTYISAGSESTVAYDVSGITYMFYTSDLRTTLKYARFGSPATTIATMAGTDKISDIAVNSNSGRLYVTYRDPSKLRNFLRVYRISDVMAGDFSKSKDLDINDGVNPDNRILDLVVDLAKNRVYARLPGTGGIVYLDDPGTSNPATTLNTGMLHFVGVNQISVSGNDGIGTGRKLVFNPVTQLLYGVAGKQVFIIDTMNDSFGVKTYTGPATLDEIVTYATDGLTLAIDRTLGQIYTIK